MDADDNIVMQSMLTEDGDVFKKFFNQSTLVKKDFNSDIREHTKNLFSKYSSKDFDQFIINVYKSLDKNCNEAMHSNNKINVSTQTTAEITFPNHRKSNDAYTQTILEECDSPCIFNRVTLNTSLRQNIRRKEVFDALKFLKNRKINQDYYALEFQSDDDVEDELAEKYSLLSKKKLDLLANVDLKKISETIEALNKMYDYQTLNICYDKFY